LEVLSFKGYFHDKTKLKNLKQNWCLLKSK
jgi:hypothetical protein